MMLSHIQAKDPRDTQPNEANHLRELTVEATQHYDEADQKNRRHRDRDHQRRVRLRRRRRRRRPRIPPCHGLLHNIVIVHHGLQVHHARAMLRRLRGQRLRRRDGALPKPLAVGGAFLGIARGERAAVEKRREAGHRDGLADHEFFLEHVGEGFLALLDVFGAEGVALEEPVPVHVDEAGLFANRELDTGGKLGGRLLGPHLHRREVVDVRKHGPRGHDVDEVLAEGALGRVPVAVGEFLLVLDGDGVDGGAKLEAAALEHDAVLVVHAGPLGKHEHRLVLRVRDVALEQCLDGLPVLALLAVEPYVVLNGEEEVLECAGDAAVALPDGAEGVVLEEEKYVDEPRVVRDVDLVRLARRARAVVAHEAGPGGDEDGGEVAQKVLLDGRPESRLAHADVHDREEEEERNEAQHENQQANRDQHAVAHPHAQEPHRDQPDMNPIRRRGPRQKVPRINRTRGKARRQQVPHHPLNPIVQTRAHIRHQRLRNRLLRDGALEVALPLGLVERELGVDA
mmetsp:Transcript_2482/g.6627  ORF Transcript_2482/g.6627 Transcript_2482/m.6627 type:complete len:512 (+) Transcript_2482:178-1713(+)